MDRWSNMVWSFSQGFKLNPNQSSLWLSLSRQGSWRGSWNSLRVRRGDFGGPPCLRS